MAPTSWSTVRWSLLVAGIIAVAGMFATWTMQAHDAALVMTAFHAQTEKALDKLQANADASVANGSKLDNLGHQMEKVSDQVEKLTLTHYTRTDAKEDHARDAAGMDMVVETLNARLNAHKGILDDLNTRMNAAEKSLAALRQWQEMYMMQMQGRSPNP